MKYKQKNILFRADSSSEIGTGHIMRDLVLAKQYPNDKILFATQYLEGNINYKISEAGYKIVNLKTDTQDELVKILKEYAIDLLVIDHYQIDFKYESYLKENFDIKILAFDDTYEKHNCDILLNHNISADKNKYKDLVPKDCELRCGTKYTLLRDEFYEAKKQKTVFLAMGGADHSNLNIKILKVLENFENIQTIIVTTSANQNLDELKKYVKGKKNIALYINSNKIAELMKKSDFAIVTPSVTVNEVHFMELPFIAIKTAQNQDDTYKYFKKDFLVLSKFNKNQLKTKIIKILKRFN